jgi:hypothetical protein
MANVTDDTSEPVEDRLRRFRLLAGKARDSAAKSSSPMDRDEFLRIAQDWEAMANVETQEHGQKD